MNHRSFFSRAAAFLGGLFAVRDTKLRRSVLRWVEPETPNRFGVPDSPGCNLLTPPPETLRIIAFHSTNLAEPFKEDYRADPAVRLVEVPGWPDGTWLHCRETEEGAFRKAWGIDP